VVLLGVVPPDPDLGVLRGLCRSLGVTKYLLQAFRKLGNWRRELFAGIVSSQKP